MINQYFIFKIKDEFLPDIIRKYIQNGKIISDSKGQYNHIYYIDQKYFRKLKIQNIENSISEDEKFVLEFLINTDLIKFLTKEEYEEKIKGWNNYGYATGSQGISGSQGVSGYKVLEEHKIGVLLGVLQVVGKL